MLSKGSHAENVKCFDDVAVWILQWWRCLLPSCVSGPGPTLLVDGFPPCVRGGGENTVRKFQNSLYIEWLSRPGSTLGRAGPRIL